MTGPEEWVCDAYGAEGQEHGALCFFAPIGARTCASHDVCGRKLTAERKRVYRQMVGRAAMPGCDPVWADLVAAIPGPEWLLGGTEADDD